MTYTMLTLPDELLFDADEWMSIRTNYNGLLLEVTRQPQPIAKRGRRGHLSVINPVTMVSKDGEVIRHHGEYVYLTWHMRRLARGDI